MCALREIAAFCDLCPACYDDRLRDRLVVGTSDDDARRRMLEVTDLTLRKAIDIRVVRFEVDFRWHSSGVAQLMYFLVLITMHASKLQFSKILRPRRPIKDF